MRTPATHGKAPRGVTGITGDFPYRLALAGGWIDQPFVNRLNPDPTGSMVVVNLHPTFRWMDRCGLATSTRVVALKRWGKLPKGDPVKRVEELYEAENRGSPHPSGSQDMIGLIYPGVNRLDYDFSFKKGLFPVHIESNNDPRVARWLEKVIHVLPVAPRPPGYSPLRTQRLTPGAIARLGRSGRDCFDAIIRRDLAAFGRSMNECMTCWEKLMPAIVRHPTLTVDLVKILKCYQARYAGAMYSGCGGGYLFIASEEPVPGAFTIQVRIAGARPSGKRSGSAG